MLLTPKKKLSIVSLFLLPVFINGMDDPLHELLHKMSVGQTAFDPEQLKVEMGMLAAKQGDLESLKNFVDSSNVNKSTHKGHTIFDGALIFAFTSKDESKFTPIFDYLFSQNAEFKRVLPGKANSVFAHATVYACKENYMRPLEILLSRGANPFVSCTSGSINAVNLCMVSKIEKNDHPGVDAVSKLFQAQATTLRHALDSLHIEKIKELANESSIEELNSTDFHPLSHILSYHRKGVQEALPILEVLLSQGANPHLLLKGFPLPGMTFMHEATKLALENGDTSILDLCIAHKGNPKYKPFPLAPSCIDLVKSAAKFEPRNPHLQKVRSVLNTGM